MDINHILACLLDSLEEQNVRDAEKYARMGLDYVEAGKSLGGIDKDELLHHLNSTIERVKAQNIANQKKIDLIESIVNFKGE